MSFLSNLLDLPRQSSGSISPRPSSATHTLIPHSILVIKKGQLESGAFPASPKFSAYSYAWLRDGGFVAYALSCVGEHEAAAKFYRWCHRVICKYSAKVYRCIARKRAGEEIDAEKDPLHTRFTVEGEEGSEPWGNFQLDGYGIYLFGVAEHCKRSGSGALVKELRASILLALNYLLELWDRPCFDCWEENPGAVHPSTLAAIYGGLAAIEPHVGAKEGYLLPDGAAAIPEVCSAIREYIEAHGVYEGRFKKSCGWGGEKDVVDGNLLWLSFFNVFSHHDPEMERTVEAIEAQLATSKGGVRRYKDDTFYGGGAWLLLTAFLGVHHVRAGRSERARALLAWIRDQADAAGDLPEQVAEEALHPEKIPEWVARWGPPAKPLLWSHAMYLVLESALADPRAFA